jgi:hypothetical protein
VLTAKDLGGRVEDKNLGAALMKGGKKVVDGKITLADIQFAGMWEIGRVEWKNVYSTMIIQGKGQEQLTKDSLTSLYQDYLRRALANPSSVGLRVRACSDLVLVLGGSYPIACPEVLEYLNSLV